MTIKTIATTLLYGLLCVCPYDLLSQCSSCDNVLSGTNLNTTANNETWCITSTPGGSVNINFNHTGVRIEVCADNVTFSNLNLSRSGTVIESWGNNTTFSGTTTFGTGGIDVIFHGSGGVMNGANVNASGIDITATDGADLTINNSWTPNSNELNFLVDTNSTINSRGMIFQAGGVEVHNGGAWNVTGSVQVNGSASLVNYDDVNISGSLVVQGGVNSLRNMCGESGITVGAQFNVSTTGAIINNGSISAYNVRFNSNAGPLNMGNGSSLIVSNNLLAQNTTNVMSFTGDAGKCALFSIAGINNWNNVLTNTSGINYCGPSTNSKPGSATLSCTCNTPVDLCNVPMPVDYLFFDVKDVAGVSQLNWATSMEENNEGFEILRSYDAHHWESIGFVDAANTISNNNQYQFEDIDREMSSTVYYRLKQKDFDGASELSPLRVLAADDKLSINVAPHPLQNNELKLYVNNAEGKVAVVEIHDMHGRLVYVNTFNLDDIHFAIDEKLGNNFSKGIYILSVLVEQNAIHQKINVE